MTLREMNLAIAKACGWTTTEHGWWSQGPAAPCHADPPDYCSDLNAMAEARKTLTLTERGRYVIDLLNIIHGPDSRIGVCWYCVDATAAQHAEAFLRAKELWREET